MIDALEIRVPKECRFTAEIDGVLDQPTLRLGETKYYRRVLDLRPYGFSSLLHYGSKQTGNHKLELMHVGTMALSSMLANVTAVIEGDPHDLQIMRIDFAADVFGYTVDWFRVNLRATHKRYNREINENGRVKTQYLGQRPNLFRIYDKGELRRIEYQKLRSDGTSKPLSSFEEFYGHSTDAILTRVERQCGGGRVPKQVDTVGNLPLNAISFNPFQPLQIRSDTGSSEAIAEMYSGDKYFKAHAFLRLVGRDGYAQARRTIQEKTSGNGRRFLKSIEPVVRGLSQAENLDLYAEYKRSVMQQLAGEGKWAK